MQVLKDHYHDIPTYLLQQYFNEESDRVMKKLMNMPPVSTDSMEVILANLRRMHSELEMRSDRGINS